ncbi:DUF2934 domain-containing protein [Telmatospirillum sp. J64-1]|uniref:DUF2934 domain-containing protein n=1 Tax=Telmatospirillum sp. J64-1 TaxID=2502183 RepID=UPI00115D955A|nr:DUF2934 domain-containing protein [Telmatospirillum sp. J64-1]
MNEGTPDDQVYRNEQVRRRAYELWEKAGRPPDRHDEFWFEAERQIDEGQPARQPS